MPYTRRDFWKITLAAAATSSLAEAAPNSRIHGVQIGAITYSLRQGVPKPEIIPDMVKIGLSEVELMSGDAEAIAGAPAANSRGSTEMKAWRASATPATFQAVKKKFSAA